MKRTASAVVVVIVAAASAQPPAAPTRGDAMFGKYLAAEADRLGGRFLDGARTLAEWQQKRPRLHQELLDMLGLWPLPEKTPLQAKITGTLERDGVVIENLYFQSRPGLYVTANLYRPKKVQGKLPAIVYVCGHSGRGRDGNKTAFQDHGWWFANHGYVCIMLDTLQLGEIPGVHHGTYREGRWWWQALGYTPAGVECWNGIRAIDYLTSRPEVDADRIGVTGISGGGATTFWIAAADDRVKVAVPVSGMSDLETYVKDKVINGHCDCMFMVNLYGWEWTTIAALIAPRPMLFANSDKDTIFPMPGNRRIMERLRGLYKLYGKPDLVDEYVSHGGHEDRPDLRVAAFRFFNRHLKNDSGPVQVAEFKPFPGRELRVFPTDADIPAGLLNGIIDETFVPRADVKLPARGEFAAWKESLLQKLRERVFRSFPKEIPPARIEDAKVKYRTLTTEPGIEVEMRQIRRPGGRDKVSHLIILNPGERTDAVPDWFPSAPEGEGIYLLAPRGVGPTAWTKKSPPNYVERAHALLGHTVDEGRVRDVASVLRSVNYGGMQWAVCGRGPSGIIGAYAALLVPDVKLKHVTVVDPPKSHRDGPIFLRVLRVLDVPEALGLLAPTPLTMVNARAPVFDRTERIYESGNYARQLRRR
jgi:dienelactone hydrolase